MEVTATDIEFKKSLSLAFFLFSFGLFTCPATYCTSITADMTSAGIYEKLNVSISGIRRPVVSQ